MLFEESEPALHLRAGEAWPEVTEDVVGVIAAAMDSTKLSSKRLGIQECGFLEPDGCEPRGRVKREIARTGQRPRAEPDRRAVALADRTDAHDEASGAWVGSRLIRMKHHARVAQRGTLNGVLAGEGGAEEQTAGWRQLQLRIQAIGEFIGMPQERLGQAMMPTVEACMHVVVAVLDVFVREGQQAAQDRGGARLLLVEPLVSWHEQSGDDA